MKIKNVVAFWITVSITIPTAMVDRSTTAFCNTYGYQSTVNGSPNPETPSAFTKRMVAEYIKALIVAYEVRSAAFTVQTDQTSQSKSDVAGIQ